MNYFRRPLFWKLCHPEREFSRISASLSFFFLNDLGGSARGLAVEAWECGGTGGGKGTATNIASCVDDAGPDGIFSGWRCTFATVGAGTSGDAVDGGGIRVVLSIEDQPPVRNVGAG